MMLFDLLIPVLSFVVVTLLQCSVGLAVLNRLNLGVRIVGWERFFTAWFVGFPLHLLFILGLAWAVSFSSWEATGAVWFWIVSLFFLSAAGFVEFRSLLALLRELRTVRVTLSFAVFFSIVFALGLGLFDTAEGITTPWANNFGDLPFHFGMITSFVFGQNLPPQYYVYPPLRLSYPFFVNLWSAVLWWPRPTFAALDTLFALQWSFLWSAVFLALRRVPLLAYALLLAGGSIESLARGLLGGDVALNDVLNGRFAREDFPWEPILSTVWVTQRSALLGVATILISLGIFHRAIEERVKRSDRELLLTGLLLGLGVLSHAHITLVALLYCGSVLTLRLMPRGKGWRELLWFGGGTLSALLSLPFLVGKTHLIKLVLGWMPWNPGEEISTRLVGSVVMWFANGLFIFPIALLFAFLVADLRRWGALLLCFIFGNLVLLSIWEWDQLKFFLGVFTVMLSIITTGRGASEKFPWYWSIPLTLLLLPGGAIFGRFLGETANHTVFSAEELRTAEEIRQHTRPCAVIAAKPDHNSPVMLSGRKLIVGYDGWLWTHGIDYGERHKAVLAGRDSAGELLRKEHQGCEGYILNSPRESWGGQLLERVY